MQSHDHKLDNVISKKFTMCTLYIKYPKNVGGFRNVINMGHFQFSELTIQWCGNSFQYFTQLLKQHVNKI